MWSAWRPEPLEFEPWVAAPALRSLPAGPVSAGVPAALIGLEPGTEPAPPPPLPEDLCGALFADPDTVDVPVAFFTDHYCPNCRSMAETLAEQPGIAVTRHELPVLGPDSVVVARAALAAGLQGARSAFHHRLRRAAFAPTETYLRDLARGLDLDADRLLADMRGAEVERQLRRDTGLAAALGFAAVPVTVVGRTVVVGDLPARTLARVVDAERGDGEPCPLGS